MRDAALKIKDELPKSDVNREYYLQVGALLLSASYPSLDLTTLTVRLTEQLPSFHLHDLTTAPQNVDSALAESATIGPGGALGKLPSHKSELLQKLARYGVQCSRYKTVLHPSCPGPRPTTREIGRTSAASG